MTPLETSQAARIAELESALRSMRDIARNAVAEQARFLADGLVHGVDRVMAQAGLGGCLGHPCDGTQCPPCAAVRSQNTGEIDTPPNVDRNPDVATDRHGFPLVLDDEARATLHANHRCAHDCPLCAALLCGKPISDPKWPCSLGKGHTGECAELPF